MLFSVLARRVRRSHTLAFQHLSFDAPATVASPAPARTAFILHGVLGSSRNWLSFSKLLGGQLARQSATPWHMYLVDLRNHGASAALPLEGPHDLRSAAADVRRLVQHIHAATPASAASSAAISAQSNAVRLAAADLVADVAADGADVAHRHPDLLIGHSLGGKVALQYVESMRSDPPRKPLPPPSPPSHPPQALGGDSRGALRVWVLDSYPGIVPAEALDAPGSVRRILDSLLALPDVLPSRAWAEKRLLELGYPAALRAWLMSSVSPIDPAAGAGGPHRFAFRLPACSSLFDSYCREDLWGALAAPPAGCHVSHVRAERSDRVWSAGDLERLRTIAAASEAAGGAYGGGGGGSGGGRAVSHVLADAGHWLHADNPRGLADLMVREILRPIQF